VPLGSLLHVGDATVVEMAQGLTDQHPKVRWAACQALGQMCTDLGPDLQSSQHARILPGLMAVMDDFSQPRVQVPPTPRAAPDSVASGFRPPHTSTVQREFRAVNGYAADGLGHDARRELHNMR